jgi:hypothetical protein
MKISGIYKIINKVNGKYYVGSSVDTSKRISNHKYNLIKNRHFNLHLQSAWNKYGKENFEFVVVETVEPTMLMETEQKYLDVCKSNPNNFYNMSYNVESTTRGIKLSKETRFLISKNNARYWKGKHHSNETKRKLSISHKGKKHSEIHKRKMSKIMSGVGNPMYGKIFSEEYRKKLSKSHIGKIVNNEIRKKISASNLGKHNNFSEEAKKKLSELMKIRCLNGKNPRTIQTKFIFIHEIHGQKICRMIDLCHNFQLTSSDVSVICKGIRQSSKGWRCLGKYQELVENPNF